MYADVFARVRRRTHRLTRSGDDRHAVLHRHVPRALRRRGAATAPTSTSSRSPVTNPSRRPTSPASRWRSSRATRGPSAHRPSSGSPSTRRTCAGSTPCRPVSTAPCSACSPVAACRSRPRRAPAPNRSPRTAMMYLLALSRGLPDLFRAQAAHEWRPKRFRELAGLPIAVVGYGPIGEHVARLAAALGMQPTIVGAERSATRPTRYARSRTSRRSSPMSTRWWSHSRWSTRRRV